MKPERFGFTWAGSIIGALVGLYWLFAHGRRFLLPLIFVGLGFGLGALIDELRRGRGPR